MAARLILNADDFGLTPGINRAIRELHAAGALTSATLMATGPAFDDAAAIARATPTLGVGCHVVLVDGTPISHPADIPSLLGPDGKTFRTSPLDFHIAVLRGTITEEDITREAAAQVQKLHRAGIDVTHLDTHKHTHIAPAVTRSLLFIAQRAGVPAIRNPFEPLWALKAAETPIVRGLQVAGMGLLRKSFTAMPALQQHAIETTDGTLGIAATGNITAAAIRRFLAALPSTGTFELVLHPGYNGPDLQAFHTHLRASRDIERAALLEVFPPTSAHLSPPQLIHFGELGHAGVLRALGQHQPSTGYEPIL